MNEAWKSMNAVGGNIIYSTIYLQSLFLPVAFPSNVNRDTAVASVEFQNRTRPLEVPIRDLLLAFNVFKVAVFLSEYTGQDPHPPPPQTWIAYYRLLALSLCSYEVLDNAVIVQEAGF